MGCDMPETTRALDAAVNFDEIVTLHAALSGKPEAEARQDMVALLTPLVEGFIDAVRELRESLEGEGINLDNPAPLVLP